MTPFRGSFQALLYDLDGTLADSFHPIRESFNAMLRHFGLSRQLSPEESLQLVGGGLEESVAQLLPSQEVARGTAIFRTHYESIYLETTHPMPYADEILSEIKNLGLPQGVVTNKLGSSARALIRHFKWESLLSLCIGEHDGYALKPSPEMLLAAAERMNVPPSRILFVGDSPFDLEAGRRAGCPVVLLSTGTHTAAELAALRPDSVEESLSGVLTWIRGSGRDR